MPSRKVFPPQLLPEKSKGVLKSIEDGTDERKKERLLQDYQKMRDCPTIRFCFFLISLPIRRARITYQHPDAEIREFVNRNLAIIRRNLTEHILAGLEFGFAPFEKRFQVIDSRVFYKEFLPLRPWHVKVLTDGVSFKGMRLFKQPIYHGEGGSFVEIPPRKSFIYTHQFRFMDFRGESLYRSARIPWLLWKEVVRLHAHTMQDHALPPLEARAPDAVLTINYDDRVEQITARELMIRVAEAIRSRSSYLLPPDEDYGIEAKQTARQWDYEKDYDLCERMIAQSLLTPRDLFREGGGSYAKAYVQSHWFAGIVDAIVEEIISFVFSFAIVPIVRYNFAKYQDPAIHDFGRLSYESLSLKDIDFLQKLALTMVKEGFADEVPEPAEILKRLHVPIKTRPGKPLLSMPISKASLFESLRKELFAEIARTKEELGFSEYISVPPQVMAFLKNFAGKTMDLVEESTDRDAVLSDALLKAHSLARALTYTALGSKVWRVDTHDDSGSIESPAREILASKDK